MSWLSKKWDQLSGKNQKVSTGTIKNEYNQAFAGARKTYGTLEERGLDMMDPNSEFNLGQKERMEGSAADAAAMSSRMAGRNAAMAGGSNAASLAAQTNAGANQAQQGAINSYNQYLQGAMSQGAGMASGAANNMAQMNQTQMNAISNQRLANAQIDSQATGLATNLLGKGIGMAFGMPPMQKGGALPTEEELAIMKGYDEFDDYHYRNEKGLRGDMDRGGLDRLPSPQPNQRWGPSNEFDDMRKELMREEMLNAEKDPKAVLEPYQSGGYAESPYGNRGGMLSQVMGPDGLPMNIKTRIGGQYVGE